MRIKLDNIQINSSQLKRLPVDTINELFSNREEKDPKTLDIIADIGKVFGYEIRGMHVYRFKNIKGNTKGVWIYNREVNKLDVIALLLNDLTEMEIKGVASHEFGHIKFEEKHKTLAKIMNKYFPSLFEYYADKMAEKYGFNPHYGK